MLEGVTNKSASWTITFSNDGNAEIKSNLSDNRSIFYNTQMARFATYTTTTQKPVQLYKFVKVVTGIINVENNTHKNTSGVYNALWTKNK